MFQGLGIPRNINQHITQAAAGHCRKPTWEHCGPEHAWTQVHGAAGEPVKARQPRLRSHEDLELHPATGVRRPLGFAAVVAAAASEKRRCRSNMFGNSNCSTGFGEVYDD